MAKDSKAILAIKAELNRMIASSPTEEQRKDIARVGASVLIAAKCYKGFGLVEWNDGGWQRWKADGEPKDNTSYLGDQTKIRFY